MQHAPASSPWPRLAILARPDCGRASTRLIRHGHSTTSARLSAPWATSSTSSCCRKSKVHGTFITSISCSPSSKLNTLCASPSSFTRSLKPPKAPTTSKRSPPPRRACTACLGPADLAASRAMKTTRVGGGHPEYKVLADAGAPDAPRAAFQQDLWHYTIAKMVDACAAAGIKPFYGPFADFADAAACETQFRNAFLMGCLGAWTLHPSQVPIAKRVFSPEPAEVAFAKKILAAMPNGSG